MDDLTYGRTSQKLVLMYNQASDLKLDHLILVQASDVKDVFKPKYNLGLSEFDFQY